ncbi:MAG TPA: hypothetical protein VGD01_04180 [Candidatus Elarobacter sp.]|jgi:hypothetical protein
MPRPDPKDSEAVTFRIPRELLALLRAEALEEGQARDSGRVYNPSATLERILREHYATKLRRRTK